MTIPDPNRPKKEGNERLYTRTKAYEQKYLIGLIKAHTRTVRRGGKGAKIIAYDKDKPLHNGNEPGPYNIADMVQFPCEPETVSRLQREHVGKLHDEPRVKTEQKIEQKKKTTTPLGSYDTLQMTNGGDPCPAPVEEDGVLVMTRIELNQFIREAVQEALGLPKLVTINEAA